MLKKFTKMNGLGNDYVYFNCLEEDLKNPSELSKKLSDRNFSIGGDGIILVLQPSDEKNDFKMKMYNSDGSEGKMCGNGIRCFGKLLYEKNLTSKKELRIETSSGVRIVYLEVENEVVISVSVDMGSPILSPIDIPANLKSTINVPIEINNMIYFITCLSMGNPHCVTFVEDLTAIDIEKIGPIFENHVFFPEGINTEFVHVSSRNHIEMRVWERGSGETKACGTGACAAVVAGYLNELCSSEVEVSLLGGILQINWDTSINKVYMKGPAEISFEGEINID